jgi:hypothetical protein
VGIDITSQIFVLKCCAVLVAAGYDAFVSTLITVGLFLRVRIK